MPSLQVKCTVANCFFHKEEDISGAEIIEIKTDAQLFTAQKEEFASDLDIGTARKKAAHSINTCCNTFKPKYI